MPITVDRRPKGTYPFRVFHTSLGFTLCTESEFKSDLTAEKVPSLVSLPTIKSSSNKMKTFVIVVTTRIISIHSDQLTHEFTHTIIYCPERCKNRVTK
jgi:formyltetrahydrofolate synthetase